MTSGGEKFDRVLDLLECILRSQQKIVMENQHLGNTSARGFPHEGRQLHNHMKSKSIPRGTGRYICPPGSSAVYVCWCDNDCVTLMSTAYPEHQDCTTKHRGKDCDG